MPTLSGYDLLLGAVILGIIILVPLIACVLAIIALAKYLKRR